MTKQLIKIQTFFKKLAINVCDTFHFVFTLDEPTVDTIQSNYIQQEKNKLTVIYTYAFFDFLNEINNHQKSIFNKESFEIIKSAFIVRFLNEDDFFKSFLYMLFYEPSHYYQVLLFVFLQMMK